MIKNVRGQRYQRILVALCGMMVAFTTLSAQGKKPTWTVKEPKVRDSYIGIVQMPKLALSDTISTNSDYRSKAKRDALWKIAAQMPWEIEQKMSLFAQLTEQGFYKSSLNDVLLAEIQKSPLFVLVGEWENDEEYWCYYSVKKNSAKEFIDCLIEDSKVKALRLYAEAKSLQSEGYIYRAAKKYIEALDSLHPAIFRYLPVPNDTGYVDLGNQLYASYLDVYKRVSMNTPLKVIPAVYGEKVPGEYFISVAQGGVPLRKLGIIVEFEGLITSTPTSDEEGRCYFSIDNVASQQENQSIKFSVDTEYLMELPPVYGYNALEGRHLFPTLKIPLKLFEPKTLVKINTESTDSLLKQSLMTLWKSNRNDVIFTERFDSADVVVEVKGEVVKEKDVPTGKYQFVQYSSNLNIEVKGVADDVSLTEYNIYDFKLMLPATRSKERVRQSALREMTRQLNREMPQIIKDYKFDKRAIVWRPLVSIEK